MSKIGEFGKKITRNFRGEIATKPQVLGPSIEITKYSNNLIGESN
jgi:hypothetical protein